MPLGDYFSPDTVDLSDNQPSRERAEYLRSHREGYNDCKEGRTPRYYTGQTPLGSAYLLGWQDANHEMIRQSFATASHHAPSTGE